MPVRQPWYADSGTVGEVSIGRLFMDGWVPGILMCTLLICGCFMETEVIFGVMTPPVGTDLYTCSDIMGCSISV